MIVNDRRYLDQLRAVATVLWVIVVLMYVAIAVPDFRAWAQGFDDQVLTWAVEAEAGPLVSVAKAASFIGSSVIMVPFMIAVAGYLFWKKQMTTMVFWVSAFAVSEAVTWISKFAYARPRPLMALVVTHGDAFPSGHADTAATVAVGVVLQLAIRASRHWYWWAVAVTYIATIAWSRIYLYAHWFSDVLAGVALGAAVIVTGLLITSSLEQHDKLPVHDEPGEATGL